LFGSYAYGTPNEDSDIDLYVVTKDEFMPQSFREKMNIKLKVANAIDSIRDSVFLQVNLLPMSNSGYKH